MSTEGVLVRGAHPAEALQLPHGDARGGVDTVRDLQLRSQRGIIAAPPAVATPALPPVWVSVDFTRTGPQRLPGATAFAAFPIDRAAPLVFESPSFALLSAQATYVVNDLLEFYGGAENLGDYRQRNAVIGAENPEVGYFDASRVYAPLMGRMPYVGLRWRVAAD